MNNSEIKDIPIISIKTIEKNTSKSYTDTQSNIDTLTKVAEITGRSFNDVLKQIVSNFIINGKIYNPEEDKYYGIEEMLKKHKETNVEK